MRRIAAALLLVLAGCGGADEPAAVGVVIDVVGDLTSVEQFTIRTADGSDLTFVPAGEARFHGLGPLGHLRSHLAGGSPVVVVYETGADGVLVAVSVDDA